MQNQISRRNVMATAGAAFAANALTPPIQQYASAQVSTQAVQQPATRPGSEIFGYCLNTSTIRGANLTIVEELDIAAKAGFTALEPWIGEINDYVKKGGSLKDLAKRVSDSGLTVEDAIGFDEWIVDDDERRAKGVEGMKRDMGMLAEIGGKRIAAPPIGANNARESLIDLKKVAERYRAILELGDTMGVQPLVELWGSSKNLHRLSEVAFVAIETGHPKASMLLDLFHLHKGGSDFAGLRLLNGAALHVIHTNDYPDHPPDQLTDAQRIFPGDGIAPFADILHTLRDIGFRGFLSLELFNRDYWKQSPLKVAQTGLQKMKDVVQKSLG